MKAFESVPFHHLYPSIMDSNKVLKALFNVLALSAVAAAAFSCTVRQLDEDLQSAPNGERVEFTASIEDEAQTRSSVDANLNFYWSPGDQVNLFYGPSEGTAGSLFTAQNTETSRSAKFSGMISAFTGAGDDGEMLSFWGVSPYLASNRCDGNSVQATLPSVQQAVAENFASNTMLMVAKSPGLSLSFKHVGAMLHIRMSRSDIVSVTFQGNAGETVAGRVSVTMDSSGKPAWSPINGQGSQSVRLDKPDCFVAGTYYYLYFLPQTFAQGWSLTFETRDGQTGTYTSNNSITFARAASRNANGLDARVTTWEAGYVEMAPGFFWAKKNVGAHSPEDYGDYFAWGETSPKDSYTESNYDYLLPFSDAATANMGEGWRTPTIAEWEALLNTNKYTWEWTTENGVNGYRVTSKVSGYVGNSIFLPADHDSSGIYWSSTISGSDTFWANCFYYTASDLYRSSSFRYELHVIRAIYDPSSVPPVSPDIPVTGVSFEIGNYAVLNGDTFALTATIAPTSATIQELTWVSSNHSVAIVSPTGVVTGKKIGTTTITARTVDGGYTASCDVTVIPNASYVDMGNGTKWATKNVGADSPEEWGGFYAWGETQTKTAYNWSTYRYGNSSSNVTIYTATDGKTVLEAGDDAATVNLGSNWRMATDAEWTWLLENCTWTYAEMNGNKGYIVKSNVSGNSSSIIFLPGAGIQMNNHGANDRCYYWSSNVSTDTYSKAKYAVIYEEGGKSMKEQYRCYGLPVRPICDPHQFIGGHECVDMGNGLKWATTNIGADSPEEYGDYFSWGATATQASYFWLYYPFMQSGKSDENYITKYTFADNNKLGIWYDGDTFIGDNGDGVEHKDFASYNYADDAARYIWGSTWRTPTDAEWTWLLENCTWTWTTDYEGTGKAGVVVTSNVTGFEGSSIFLPAAGGKFDKDLYTDGTMGHYWSSSLGESFTSNARAVSFSANSMGRNYTERVIGQSVRPVSN